MKGLVLQRKHLMNAAKNYSFDKIRYTLFKRDIFNQIEETNLVLFVEDGKIKVIKDRFSEILEEK